MSKKPKVSIIIPVHNEQSDILECLISLNNQSIPNKIEIVIVDDGSTDKTVSVISSYKKKSIIPIKILHGEHKGPGFSRNLGAKSAKGEFLVFIDADMTFEKRYLENLIAPMIKDKKLIGTCHDYEIVENISNIWSRCWGRIRVSKEEAKNITIFRAIRKFIFLKLGGFDSKYGYADDQSLYLKHGIKPYVASDTTCYHKNPETLKSVYKQSRWIGASLENSILSLKPINYLIPPILLITLPIAIPILSIKKILKNKDLSIIFPWMLIFMTFRYFGTISGISRKIYLKLNVR